MNYRYNSANLDELISNCIYGYYIRYDRLAALINSEFYNSNASELYIYIDLQDILRHVDRYINKSQIPVSNPLVITSGIINAIAHYRNFFRTRYNCSTKFWIVDSVNNIISKKMYGSFCTTQLSLNMSKLYTANIDLLKSLCLYIPDVQYDSTEVDFVCKVGFINNIENKNNDPAFLITKDPFSYQACILPNVYILRPKKNKTGDVSILIKNNTAVFGYISEISKNPKIIEPISVEQLSMLMALSRVPSRHIDTLFTLTSAQTILHTTYVNGATRGYIWDLESFLDIMMMHNRSRIKTIDEVRYRYMACEVTVSQSESLKILPESKLYNGIVNLYDPEGIKSINNEFFKSCPLDLNVL